MSLEPALEMNNERVSLKIVKDEPCQPISHFKVTHLNYSENYRNR